MTAKHLEVRISQLEQALESANQEAQLQRESCVQLEQALEEARAYAEALEKRVDALVGVRDELRAGKERWREIADATSHEAQRLAGERDEATLALERLQEAFDNLDALRLTTLRELDEARARVEPAPGSVAEWAIEDPTEPRAEEQPKREGYYTNAQAERDAGY